MATASHSRRLLTAEEAAEQLGIALWAAYELIRQKQLPVVRIGRRVRVSREALDDFIRNGGTAASSAA